MSIGLSDIAKYAYGNGFREGVNGGRGYLAVGTDGRISKICTHIGSSGKLDNLTNADFRILKEGSDRLVTILYNLAAQKLSGAALAEVCQKLHVDEKGRPLAEAEGASRTKQLIGRKIVASVVSLIDPDVWSAREGGKTIAEMAKAVSTKGHKTDGTDMIADEKMKDALSGVGETLAMVARRTDPARSAMGLEKFKPAEVDRFVDAVKSIIYRDLTRLPKDGTMVGGCPTACRGELARVVVPEFLYQLGKAVVSIPGMVNADLSQIDLIRAYKSLPNVKLNENAKFTQNGVKIKITDTAESINPLGVLEKTLSEDSQKLLEHVLGVVIQNGTTLPGGKNLTFRNGYLYLARDVAPAKGMKHQKAPRPMPEPKAEVPAPSKPKVNVTNQAPAPAKPKVNTNTTNHVTRYRDVSEKDLGLLSDSAKALRRRLLNMNVQPAEQRNEENGMCLPVKYFDSVTGKEFRFDEYVQGGGDGYHCFFLSTLRHLGLTPSNGNARNLRVLMGETVDQLVNHKNMPDSSPVWYSDEGFPILDDDSYVELKTSFEEGVFNRDSRLPADASTGLVLAHLLQCPVTIVTTETNRPNEATFKTYDIDFMNGDNLNARGRAPVYIHFSCTRNPVTQRIETGHFQAMDLTGSVKL